jgi:glycosyltransferase involved in cell wall biosynthesis
VIIKLKKKKYLQKAGVINIVRAFISIIIPIYNSEKYLEQCLDSVLKQSYSNYEVIMIDDESTDSSRMIYEKFVHTDKRFVSYHQKNHGVSGARNKGLDVAKGDIIVFLDSDDMIFPVFLEHIVQLFEEGNDLICFSAVNFKENIQCADICEDIFEVSVEKYTPEKLIENLLYHRQQLSITRSAYRREKYPELRFRKELHICEDVIMLLEILVLCTDEIPFVKTKLYGYRLHKQSLTHYGNWRKKLTGLTAMNIMEDILLDHDIYMEKAFISRRMNSMRLIYKSIPWKERRERNIVWENIRKYRKTVITDVQAQKAERLAAVVSLCGQRVYRFVLFLAETVR